VGRIGDLSTRPVITTASNDQHHEGRPATSRGRSEATSSRPSVLRGGGPTGLTPRSEGHGRIAPRRPSPSYMHALHLQSRRRWADIGTVPDDVRRTASRSLELSRGRAL